MKRGPGPAPVNRERRAKLRAEQFGTDGYREHVIASPCLVTGTLPVDPAHVLKSRGAGGGPEHMGPLCRAVHRDFDDMGEARFRARWGVTKEEVRDRCRVFRARWETVHGE